MWSFQKKNCQLNSIEDSILRYPEIISIVDNLKSKKTRIAFQSKEFGEHFEVIVGHNNPERFETFFKFKIIKKNCAYYVYSKELDKYISIQEWRKSKFDDNTKISLNFEPKFTELPFDFNDYFENSQLNHNETGSEKYMQYYFEENKNIWELFEIDSNASSVLFLPKLNNFQPIILTYTDSDINGYYLQILKNNKVSSKLLVGRMDGNEIMDFTVSKNYDISLFRRLTLTDDRILIKKYFINSSGQFEVGKF